MNKVPTLKWSIWAVVLSWFCGVLPGILSLLMVPLLLVPAIWFIVNRAFRPLLLIIFLNPLSVLFIGGVFSYCQGQPELHGGGWVPFRRLDRKTRCFYCIDRSCTGSPLDGWYDDVAHNGAIRLMVALFGYARNSYDGPYPTTAEAVALVTNAPPTARSLLAVNKLLVNGHEVELGQKALARCLYICRDAMSFTNKNDLRPALQATLHQQRCLILYVYDASETNCGLDTVVLVDYQRMWPIFFQRVLRPDRFQ